ncbi:MAG: HD domain-containing protein [Dehalococcoidia bacterium]|nr:HD domain-containing protein [Dehalococcoidia bacterium]
MNPFARAIYRTGQVRHALWPRINAAELASVCEVLSDGTAALFYAMEKRDQRHGLEVTRRLRESGATGQELLAAALLHDCGKGPVPVWLRVLKVASPGTLRRLAREGGGWRGAAFRLQEHASIGARLATAAGAGALTVRLIEGRVEPGEEPLQALLLSADDAS